MCIRYAWREIVFSKGLIVWAIVIKIAEGEKCTKCGFVNTDFMPSHRLKPGTMLSGRYFIGNALGEGGFGITYIGFDTRLEMKVAVKEYFPSGFVTRYIKDSSTVEVSNQKIVNSLILVRSSSCVKQG